METGKEKWRVGHTYFKSVWFFLQFQAQQTESRIKAEFQKLYQFLREEEAGRIDACRQEATFKTDVMKETIINLTAEISELSKKIKTVEEEMRSGDLPFMLVNIECSVKVCLIMIF